MEKKKNKGETQECISPNIRSCRTHPGQLAGQFSCPIRTDLRAMFTISSTQSASCVK